MKGFKQWVIDNSYFDGKTIDNFKFKNNYDLAEKYAKEQVEAITVTRCCKSDSELLPSIIEIDFDGHLKCQIETTDKLPNVLKAVNGYGQPVDCREGKIRINEV